MRIEHLALMVHDPAAVAAWYCEHLGFQIKRASDEAPFAHFLADRTGRVMIELYNNPVTTVPDYASVHPLQLHVAFCVDDVPATRARLLAAGASSEEPLSTTHAGDQLTMLRDPWHMPIQLVRRAAPMV